MQKPHDVPKVHELFYREIRHRVDDVGFVRVVLGDVNGHGRSLGFAGGMVLEEAVEVCENRIEPPRGGAAAQLELHFGWMVSWVVSQRLMSAISCGHTS